MAGLATAATSATVRFPHAVSCCQLGFETYLLQPLPAPLQAVSAQPRAPVARVSDVPPTATTVLYAAGTSTP